MNELLLGLWRHASVRPDKDAYVQLDRNARIVRRIPFQELKDRVIQTSRLLSSQVQPDARVLVLFENAFDFIPAFLACMHCGCIPASMQIPNGPGKLAKLRDIVAVEAVERIIVPESLLAKGWFR